MDNDLACFGYSATEYAVFSLSRMTVTDVAMPVPLSGPSGAFTGLSGYMTLGLGAKSKPGAVRLNQDETLIIKDSVSSSFCCQNVLLCFQTRV